MSKASEESADGGPNSCEPIGDTPVKCPCDGVLRGGCGCVGTTPATHFHADGRRLGGQCKDCPVCATSDQQHTWRHYREARIAGEAGEVR